MIKKAEDTLRPGLSWHVPKGRISKWSEWFTKEIDVELNEKGKFYENMTHDEINAFIRKMGIQYPLQSFPGGLKLSEGTK